MKSFVRLLIFAVIGIPMLAFAMANRHQIAIGLDPLANQLAENSPKLPLFVVVFASLMLGVVLGGMATWLGQGKHRRAARLSRNELKRLRAERPDELQQVNLR